jgi:DNA-binding GntR family transcriptional regulator
MKFVIKESAEAQAINILRERILSGAYAPKAALTEIGLANQLKVSRATIRAALQQMVHERLVRRKPYSGWQLTSISALDVREIFTLRASLEALAASRVAANISPQACEVLKNKILGFEEAAENNSFSDCSSVDYAFHKSIIKLADHYRLAEHYNIIEQEIQLCIAWSNALVFCITNILTQHRPIADALLSGKGNEAAALLKNHILSEGEKLIRHLDNESYHFQSN